MCTKCDAEIKAALDHVIVAALKLARLTGSEYRVSSLRGVLFTIMPVIVVSDDIDKATVVVVRETSTADELKTQARNFLARMHDPTPEAHASKMEFVDKTDEAFVVPFISN